jgi:hypothetical protein
MPKAIRFEIVAVSKEFLEILEDMPEASMASSVTIGNRKIEGPKERLEANSAEEALNVAIEQAKKLKSPEEFTIIITERQAMCYTCPGEDQDVVVNCPHFSRLASLNSPRSINAAELLKKAVV